MKSIVLMTHYELDDARKTLRAALALLVAGILAIGPVMADKPSWAGGGKGGKEDRVERGDGEKGGRHDREGARRDGDKRGQGKHFEDRQQAMVRDYYAVEFQRGRCPPGLAKKHNGCMPPGQAKKWQMGRPLPRGLIYHDVPQPLLVQIGQPPSGYRYVRVAGDILMMALGTGMIVDAIRDLGR